MAAHFLSVKASPARSSPRHEVARRQIPAQAGQRTERSGILAGLRGG
ncbi:MAG: hypothetical protein RSC52_00215 [Oscillospiraceae bacterium]